MPRAVCISVLAILLITVTGSAATAGPKRTMSQGSFEQMIEIQPLILEGEVTKVDVRLITPMELWGRGSRTVHVAMTEVTMKIEKVIAGEYDGAKVTIVLEEGRTAGITSVDADFGLMKVNVGDRAIVAFRPDSQGTGLNVLDNNYFFRVEGTKLIPYREEIDLAVDKPLEILAKKAKEREMPEVVKNADLICTGTVTRLVDLHSPSRRFIVSIDETLKGRAEQSEITVDMSGIFLSRQIQEPGFQVMLFLKKDGTEYKPVAGVNGYYEMHGEKLTRGHSVPVKMTASQFKSKIKMWKEVE